MAITIIHGANGGYKTSSVVQDRIIPAMIQGRTVVTNIRGVELKKFYDSGFDVHQDSRIIYVDTDNNKQGKIGRKLMACFWHWVPSDCLICFDEAGVIFPKTWRDKDILNVDNYIDECSDHSIFDNYDIEKIDRPDSFVEAFEMHRHYGWDLVLSAPNIKSIRDEIRNTSELAWRHRNAALIGIKGRYKGVSHDPINLGTSPSHALDFKIGKIKDETFACYESTKNGSVKDTANATGSIFTPRLFLAVACAAIAFGYAFTSGGLSTLGKAPSQINSSSTLESTDKKTSIDVSNNVLISQSDPNDFLNVMGYEFLTVRIKGSFGAYMVFEGTDRNGDDFEFTHSDLLAMDYMTIVKNDCHVLLLTPNGSQSIYCKLYKPLDSDLGTERSSKNEVAVF